jgi:hypothetical protein
MHDHSHKIGHRGVYKYVLTQNTQGTWRVSVVNGTDAEKDPSTILAILQQAVANCQALIQPS